MFLIAATLQPADWLWCARQDAHTIADLATGRGDLVFSDLRISIALVEASSAFNRKTSMSWRRTLKAQ